MLCAIGGLFKVCEIKEMDYKVGELLSPRLSLFLVFFKEPLKAVMVFTLRKKNHLWLIFLSIFRVFVFPPVPVSV